MRKAYSYLRFSTPEQMGGDSLRRQTAGTTKWCKDNNVELDTELSFNDFGRSGFTGANFEEGALGVFDSLVRNGTIRPGSYLVLESLDRFSRENPMRAAGRLFDLVTAGISIVTVDDGKVYSPESLGGRDVTFMLVLVVKMSQAHLESLQKSERVGEAWNKKKTLARSELKPMTPRCPEWLRLVDGKFEQIDDRVKTIRRIFKETIDGHGRREIVRRLNADNIRPFRSKDGSKGWQTSAVAKIVQGRMVLGEYQPHRGTHIRRNRQPDGDPIQNYYPPIIDEKTFWLANSAISDRRGPSAGRKGVEGAHILRGLAKCGSCGGSMHVVNKGKLPKGGVYLACSANRRNFNCDNATSWRVDKLEEALLLCLTSVKTNSFDSMKDGVVDVGQTVAAMNTELDDLGRRKDVYMRLAESGDEQAEARFFELSAAIKAKKKELKAAEAELGARKGDPGDHARLSETLQLSKTLFKAEGEERREIRTRLSSLIRRLVAKIECNPVRGAFMVLKMESKALRVINPIEGAFAWQIDAVPKYRDGPDVRLLFLLVNRPTDEQRDAFFDEKGGSVVSPEGMVNFMSPHAGKRRQK